MRRSGRKNELILEFTSMLRERKEERFDAWLEQQGISELRSFAQSRKKDYEVVKAGLTRPWSPGPVEGHVHRLKLLKRQEYGRASFPMLRKRVLRCSFSSRSREARPRIINFDTVGEPPSAGGLDSV